LAAWLYQMNQGLWPPSSYRLDVWENERWSWPIGRVRGSETPRPGDRLFFFFAPSGGAEGGICGWAVVLDWPASDDDTRVRFRPVAPSDQLKMCPWWDDEVKQIVDQVRGAVKQGTVWPVDDATAQALGRGIARWVGGTP
jgi:hypothetical protein